VTTRPIERTGITQTTEAAVADDADNGCCSATTPLASSTLIDASLLASLDDHSTQRNAAPSNDKVDFLALVRELTRLVLSVSDNLIVDEEEEVDDDDDDNDSGLTIVDERVNNNGDDDDDDEEEADDDKVDDE
jgi:hypothetical protein